MLAKVSSEENLAFSMGKGGNSTECVIQAGDNNENPQSENNLKSTSNSPGKEVHSNQLTPSEGNHRRQINLLIIASILDIFTISVVFPVLPSLFQEFGLLPTHQGWASSLFSFLSFTMAPIFGRWSDVHGRVIFLRMAAVVSTLGYFCTSLALNKWVFLAARILPGLAKCQIPLSQAYMADVSSDADRTKNLGMLGAAFGFAFIFGPVLGGYAANSNIRMPFYIAIGVGLLNLFTLSLLQEPKQQLKKKKVQETSLISFFRSKEAGKLLLLFHNRFAFLFGESIYQSTFIVHFSKHYGLNGGQLGLLLSYLGVLGLFSNLVGVRFMVRLIPEHFLLILAAAVQALCMLVVFSTGDLRVACVTLAVMAVMATTFTTVTSAQISKSVGPERVGTVMGVSSAVDTIVRIVCPPLSGLIFDRFGSNCSGFAASAAIMYCFLGTISREAVLPNLELSASAQESCPVSSMQKKND